MSPPLPSPTLPQLGLCDQQLTELSNPGASGSLFYISCNDEFIIKTVQKKETEFLQKLLPGYYLVRFMSSAHPLDATVLFSANCKCTRPYIYVQRCWVKCSKTLWL